MSNFLIFSFIFTTAINITFLYMSAETLVDIFTDFLVCKINYIVMSESAGRTVLEPACETPC